MKIVVYGLGIIGASVAASLKKAGHFVLGRNRSREPVAYALEHDMIDGEALSYEGADVVFLALPPRVVMRELEEGAFPEGCIVADICGVKQPIESVVYKTALPRRYRYVGTHPMAGKETSGIRSASDALFCGANFVITHAAQTDGAALSVMRSLAADMGFGRIIECTAGEHDRMIALTSQLAHVVSNAYVTSPLTENCVGFTGGSFQDMTRVAPVDENVWAELYMLNRENLLGEIDRITDRLNKFRAVLAAGDEASLRTLQREGKECFRMFFKKN